MPGPTFGFVKLLASSGSHCTKWADEQHRQAGFESRLVPDLPLPFIPTLIGLRAFDLVSSRVWWEAATNTRLRNTSRVITNHLSGKMKSLLMPHTTLSRTCASIRALSLSLSLSLPGDSRLSRLLRFSSRLSLEYSFYHVKVHNVQHQAKLSRFHYNSLRPMTSGLFPAHLTTHLLVRNDTWTKWHSNTVYEFSQFYSSCISLKSEIIRHVFIMLQDNP